MLKLFPQGSNIFTVNILSTIVLLFILADKSASPTKPNERNFTFEYTVAVKIIPENTEEVMVWVPIPHSNPYQEISDLRVEASSPYEINTMQYGNKALHISLKKPKVANLSIKLSLKIKRLEHIGPLAGRNIQPFYVAEPADPDIARWLQPDRLVPIDNKIKEWALEVVKTAQAKTDMEKALAIYNHIVATVKYDKSGQGWGRGDIYYACDARRGNCTDFHAIFIGYCRAVGIPARFAIGFSLPAARGEGQVSGYHCWAEFYLRGQGWIPIDASEAAKDPSKREYFFGTHDENRVEFTRGRDLILDPKPKGDPLNYFIYPYVEADGKLISTIEKSFTYRDISQ